MGVGCVSEECFSLLRSVLRPELNAGLGGKRGQEPIAKWPKGCFALLVPDPFSQLLSQLLEQFAKVRHLFAKHVIPCFGIPDLNTNDRTDNNDFFSCVNTQK